MVQVDSRAKLVKLLQASQGSKQVRSRSRRLSGSAWVPSAGTGRSPVTSQIRAQSRPKTVGWVPRSHTGLLPTAANHSGQRGSLSRPASVASRKQTPGRFTNLLDSNMQPIGSRQQSTRSRSVAWDRPSAKSTQRTQPNTLQPNGHGPTPSHVTQYLNENPEIDPRAMAAIHKNMQDKMFSDTREAFRYFDGKGAGAVHFPGFKNALERLGIVSDSRLSVDQIKALFFICDQDGDGRVNYQEFCKWIKVPDKHENLMVRREDPYQGTMGGMSYKERTNWIRKFGIMCE